jgi:hypothetical protein
MEEEPSEPEPTPQPSTESAGGVRPPGRIGGGIDDEGDDEGQPPYGFGKADRDWGDDSPIEALDLPKHVQGQLVGAGITTIGELLATDEIRVIAMIRASHVVAKLANLSGQRAQSDTRVKEEAYHDLRRRLSEYAVLDYESPWPAGG